jgi:hypothetical protein
MRDEIFQLPVCMVPIAASANMASHVGSKLAGQTPQLVISDGWVRQDRRKRIALRFDGYAVVPDRGGVLAGLAVEYLQALDLDRLE